MNRNITKLSALLAAASALSVISTAPAGAEEPAMIRITDKAPVIDTTKNPGCGVTIKDKQGRIKRNADIARFYFQQYAEMPQKHLKYSLGTYDCWADGLTILSGSFSPPPAAPQAMPLPLQDRKPGEPDPFQKEALAWLVNAPDQQAVPGTLRIIPWENGVNYSLMYSGTAQGQRFSFWEVGIMLINEDGKITHYEMWNDSAAMENAFKLAFGQGFLENGGAEYGKAIDEMLEKKEKP